MAGKRGVKVIKVDGADQLQAKLDALPEKIRERARQAVAAAADAVQADARAEVPVDTGALKDSITVENSGLSADVSAGEHYAPFVEFGTSTRPAQPFLTPAAEVERGRFPDRIRDATEGQLT